MNEVGVVISRYYEDLKWVEELSSPIDVYVYDRIGDSPGMGAPEAVAWFKPTDDRKRITEILNLERITNNGVNLQVINMEDDAGFEASTYLYHFHTKYDKLNDITVCLQGHPEIYIKNIMSLLNDPHRLARTKWESSSSGHQLNSAKLTSYDDPVDFSYISDNFGFVGPDYDYGWAPHKNDFTKSPWWFFVKNMPGWTEDKSKLGTIDGFPFGAGNQFIVNKKSVLKHEPDYYRRIQEFTKIYLDPNGDKRPHWQQLNQGPNIMEGTWKFVF